MNLVYYSNLYLLKPVFDASSLQEWHSWCGRRIDSNLAVCYIQSCKTWTRFISFPNLEPPGTKSLENGTHRCQCPPWWEPQRPAGRPKTEDRTSNGTTQTDPRSKNYDLGVCLWNDDMTISSKSMFVASFQRCPRLILNLASLSSGPLLVRLHEKLEEGCALSPVVFS